MKFGAVYTNEQINAFYRVYLPMMAMQQRGHEILELLQERGGRLPIEQLADCDLVHIHRLQFAEDDDDSIARLREAGVAVGFDDDDSRAAAPPELERFVPEGLLPRAQRDYERMLARASQIDLLTTPSEEIADNFEDAGASNIEVIDNYLPGAFNRVDAEGHDGFVVGWHAASEHALDVEALGLRRILGGLLEQHADLRVVTLGIDLELEHERYECERPVRIHDLTQRLADFDLGIAPLADTPFNRGRSNVKVREYAAAGVPWLASPVGSYAHLGPDEGGRLVEDDVWAAALDELIGSRRERGKLAKRAKAWAKRETIWNMAGVWEQAFLDTVAAVRATA